MDFDWKDFDACMRERTKREGCPIPRGFEERMYRRMAQLDKSGRKCWTRRRVVMLVAAVLLLTACTAGAATMVLRQARYEYFDTMQEAGEAATQAALEAGQDSAAVGVGGYGEIEDFPPLEIWDLEEVMSRYDQISAYAEGREKDGWTWMFTGSNGESVSTYYVADNLSGLADLWPETAAVPDLEWLEEHYSFLEGGQCLIDWKALSSDLAFLIDSTLIYGACYSLEGGPVSLNWTFYEKHQVSDQFMVNDGLDRVEEYTTADGAEVTIEWMTSVNGQSLFHAQYGYGYTDFSASGAEMEPEEVYGLLDHMNLSALMEYRQ